MICQHGGLTFICHNELHDITAEWLDKVCYDITIEPPLQQLTGETFIPATANWQDEARTDIRASEFQRCHQSAFFVFHPNAPTKLSQLNHPF